MKWKPHMGQPVQAGQDIAFVNPGTGPVLGATEENAAKNVIQLLHDVGINAEVVRVSEWDCEGRFGFELQHEGHTCQVDMPGWELEQVRWMDLETQNIWDFSRLYINGSSWVWKFAVNSVRYTLEEEKNDDEVRTQNDHDED